MRSILTKAAALIAAGAIAVEASPDIDTSSDSTITASNPILTVTKTYTLSATSDLPDLTSSPTESYTGYPPDDDDISSSVSGPGPACPTVTSTASICATCVRPACLVYSTVTQDCACPVVTATTSFPCQSASKTGSSSVDGYCPSLGCDTSYVVVGPGATATEDCSASSSGRGYTTATSTSRSSESTSSTLGSSSGGSGGDGSEPEPTLSSTGSGGSSGPSSTKPAPSGTTSGPVEAGVGRLGLSLGLGGLVAFVGLLLV